MIYAIIDMIATGDNLRIIREHNGLTRTQLKNMLGVTYPAIRGWELGEKLPSIDHLLSLSRIYAISVEDLIVYEVDKIK